MNPICWLDSNLVYVLWIKYIMSSRPIHCYWNTIVSNCIQSCWDCWQNITLHTHAQKILQDLIFSVLCHFDLTRCCGGKSRPGPTYHSSAIFTLSSKTCKAHASEVLTFKILAQKAQKSVLDSAKQNQKHSSEREEESSVWSSASGAPGSFQTKVVYLIELPQTITN